MEKKKRQRYSRGFKEQVLARMRIGESVRRLSLELQVARGVLFAWRKEAEQRPGGEQYEKRRQQREGEIGALEARIAELEGVVGRQTLELDFFQSALRRFEGQAPSSESAGEKPSRLKSAAGWNRKAN